MASMLVGDFEKSTVAPGVHVYVHPTKKFKTITIKVYVHQALDPEVAKLALLPFVLRRGCRRFPTQRKIVLFLEEQYGASMSADVLKIGERQILYFRMETINDRHAPKRIHALRRALEFLGLLITRPVKVRGAFREDYVAQEKENLIRLIESLIDDRMSYAFERCIQEMCKGEPYARYEYGTSEEVGRLEAAELTEAHLRVLAEAPVELFVVGDVAPSTVSELAARALPFRERRPQTLPPVVIRTATNGVREVVENIDVEQGKLVIGARTGITWADDDVFALVYYNGLLGGFPHSKLFVNVRERDGLAYSAGSSLDTSKGLLFLSAGIDPGKYAECVRVMREQMAEVEAGNFSEEDFEKTRKTLVDRIRSREDNASGKIGGFAEMLLNGRPLTPAEVIGRLEKVTPADVRRVAPRVKLDTIYFLSRPP